MIGSLPMTQLASRMFTCGKPVSFHSMINSGNHGIESLKSTEADSHAA